MGFGFLFKVTHPRTCVFVPGRSLEFRFVSTQVDEHSVFRHRGERKVKTVEEDDVTSRTAELLNEEGEELMGNKHRGFVGRQLCVTSRRRWTTLPPAAGDDSSDGDEGEEECDDSEVKEITPGPGEDSDTRDEESEETSFPDTTISLSHLQPSRYILVHSETKVQNKIIKITHLIVRQCSEARIQKGSNTSGKYTALNQLKS